MRSKPPRFLWGAATSSHQIERGNEHNDWWAWEAEGHVEGGVRSGDATDHWNRFREDLQLAASLGLNTYRFSIEWSRLEPEEGCPLLFLYVTFTRSPFFKSLSCGATAGSAFKVSIEPSAAFNVNIWAFRLTDITLRVT